MTNASGRDASFIAPAGAESSSARFRPSHALSLRRRTADASLASCRSSSCAACCSDTAPSSPRHSACTGGVAAESATARAALTEARLRLARELGVELPRSCATSRPQNPDSGPPSRCYVTFRKPHRQATTSATLRPIPRKQRAMVPQGHRGRSRRRARRRRRRALRHATPRASATSARPCSRRRYLQSARRSVRRGLRGAGRAARRRARRGGHELLLPRRSACRTMAADRDSARDLKANDFMYWEVMTAGGCARGARLFDYRPQQSSTRDRISIQEALGLRAAAAATTSTTSCKRASRCPT